MGVFIVGLITAQIAGIALGEQFAGVESSVEQQPSRTTPKDIISPTVSPAISPDASELEDNPEREDDDNPGESSRNRRGRDH